MLVLSGEWVWNWDFGFAKIDITTVCCKGCEKDGDGKQGIALVKKADFPLNVSET